MEEAGTIVELKGKYTALVICKKSSFCENCASMESCHLGDDNHSMVVEAHNTIGAKVGDKVKLTTSTKSFLQSSFLLYIVPLIALVTGAVIGNITGDYLDIGIEANLLSAIIGVAFLVGSFLAIKVGSRALPKENYMPQIVAIIPEDAVFTEDLQHGN